MTIKEERPEQNSPAKAETITKKADTELTEEQLGTVAGGTVPPPGLTKPTLTPGKKIVLDLDGKPMGYPPNTFDGGPSSG